MNYLGKIHPVFNWISMGLAMLAILVGFVWLWVDMLNGRARNEEGCCSIFGKKLRNSQNILFANYSTIP